MTAPRWTVTAPAKINLALHVTGRRADGYHVLDSVAVFAGLGDRVAVQSSDALQLQVTGPFARHAPADRTDLAWRAAEAFYLRAGAVPAVRIEIEKNIPAGAGLGGGSADAAAVLSALDEFSGAKLPARDLAALGLTLGADVPMCLAGRALRARGIGEVIAAVEGWPPLPLVLIWPGRAVSTAAIFKALPKRDNPPLTDVPAAAGVADIATWLAGCRNDLEPPALSVAPEIAFALAELRASAGCLIARMSGSGSACFGLYGDVADAERAAASIAAGRPDWWVRSTVAT
jgi:4-diphosphocytidyl-2-C-methyl-D-erythritol kinase